MCNTFTSAPSRRLLFAISVCAATSLAAFPAWSQEKKEPSAPDAKAAAIDSNDSKDSEQDAPKQPANAAKDSAKDSAKDVKQSAKDASKSVKDTAKDVSRQTDRTKDSAKSSADRASAGKDTAEPSRARAKDSQGSARDSARNARDAREARDGRRDTRDDRDLRDTPDASERPDARDVDRRDARRDGDRRGDRVFRSRIDNFRADSVSARDLGVTFGRASDRGLVISDLSRSAVLADVGLRPNDVIVSVADHRVANQREFFRWLFAEDLRNDRITIIVLRDGREVPIYVRPVTIIEELVVVQDDVSPLRRFGVVVDERRPREIVVMRVYPNSPAFSAGIREGDVITTFRGQRLLGPQQFVQVLSRVEPGEVAIEVNRNRQLRQLQVDVPRFERRTVARPDLDVDRPSIERREERRENRIERREERRDDVPGAQPGEPARPATPARPARPGILPRNR